MAVVQSEMMNALGPGNETVSLEKSTGPHPATSAEILAFSPASVTVDGHRDAEDMSEASESGAPPG